MALKYPKPEPSPPDRQPETILVTGIGRFPNNKYRPTKGIITEPERK